MGVVERRYIDFLIILLIPTHLYLQHHSFFFVHLKGYVILDAEIEAKDLLLYQIQYRYLKLRQLKL